MRDRLQEEAGQAIVFLAVGMVLFIAMAGFTIDVGHAYLVQRQLQAATDAAALAGALELPDPVEARSMADAYGAGPGGHNQVRSANGAVTMKATTTCIKSIPGCETDATIPNAIVVTGTSDVPTVFAKILGFNSFSVDTKATACSPCKATLVDVMLVLDRTGSMCTPDCGNFDRARDGMRTFIRQMDPRYVKIGLAVLPPAASTAEACDAPKNGNAFTSNYNLRDSAYTLVPLSKDYASKKGTINEGSTLVKTIKCVHSSGRTAYADAIMAAQAALSDTRYNQPGATKVIIFLSDGAANYGPTFYDGSSPYRTQPCHQGIVEAGKAKNLGTTIYSIGYALPRDPDSPMGFEQCKREDHGMVDEEPEMDAFQALESIATSAKDTFYNVPDDAKLTAVFSSIAADVVRTAQLIDNSAS